jgi:hypothetical protein
VFAPLRRSLHNCDVLPALRELLSQHPGMTRSGLESLSRALYVFRFLPYQPETFEVEAALEALCVEGEVAA